MKLGWVWRVWRGGVFEEGHCNCGSTLLCDRLAHAVEEEQMADCEWKNVASTY
jgi:hypothetical protein